MREIDPPGYRITKTSSCEQPAMHVVREFGGVRIDWISNKTVVRDFRFCVQCAQPLRVECSDDEHAVDAAGCPR